MNEAMKLIRVTRKTSTTELPIGGGRNFPKNDSERQSWLNTHSGDVGKERAQQLLDRYGTGAESLIAKIAEQGETILPGGEYSDIEIQHLVETESVSQLSDLVFRRTNIGFVGEFEKGLVDRLASISAEALGWKKSEQKSQLSSISK